MHFFYSRQAGGKARYGGYILRRIVKAGYYGGSYYQVCAAFCNAERVFQDKLVWNSRVFLMLCAVYMLDIHKVGINKGEHFLYHRKLSERGCFDRRCDSVLAGGF